MASAPRRAPTLLNSGSISWSPKSARAVIPVRSGLTSAAIGSVVAGDMTLERARGKDLYQRPIKSENLMSREAVSA
jgi:hypothetical protein